METVISRHSITIIPPIFNLDLDEVEKFIREKVPTIRKGYKAVLCGLWTNNYIYGREELTIRF